MAEVASAFVTLLPSARGFGSKLDKEISGDVDSAGKRAGGRFGAALKVGALAAVGGVALFGGFLKGAIGAASDLQESGTKIAAVFGRDGAAAVQKFASRGAEALGQTRLEVLNASASFGTFGKAAGLSGVELAKFSTGFASLSTDLASFYNTSPEEAVEAIGAALRGEAEPIRKYGVLLDDATLRQEALRLGLIKTTKQALTPQQKVLAAQAAIYKQTKDAQGDFQRTSGGLANQQRILAAQFGDLKASIGQAFLPIAVKAVTFLNKGFANVGPIIDRVRAAFEGLGGGGALSGLVAGVKGFGKAVIAAFSKIGLSALIGGILTTGAALFAFFKSLLPTLTKIGSQIGAVLGPAFKEIGNLITTQLLPAFRAILPILTPVVKFLLNVLGSAVIGVLKGVVQAVKGAINIIAGVLKLIVAIVKGDWSGAWEALKQVVMGAVNAVIGIVRAWLNIGILQLFRKGLLSIGNLWKKAWDGIRNLGSKAASGVRNLFSKMFSAIGKLIGNAVKGYINFWRNMFKGLVDLTRNGWRVLRSAFGGALAAIRTVVTQAMSKIRTTFTAAWTAIRTATSTAFTRIVNAVRTGIGNAVDFVKRFPGRVKDGLGNLGKTLYNAGKELIGGLIRGITEKMDAAVQKVKDGLSKIGRLLPGSPIKEGPLKSWNRGGAGKRLIGLLVQGIDSSTPALDSSMNRLVSRIALPSPRLDSTVANTSGGSANAAAGAGVKIDVYDRSGSPERTARETARQLAWAGVG